MTIRLDTKNAYECALQQVSNEFARDGLRILFRNTASDSRTRSLNVLLAPQHSLQFATILVGMQIGPNRVEIVTDPNRRCFIDSVDEFKRYFRDALQEQTETIRWLRATRPENVAGILEIGPPPEALNPTTKPSADLDVHVPYEDQVEFARLAEENEGSTEHDIVVKPSCWSSYDAESSYLLLRSGGYRMNIILHTPCDDETVHIHGKVQPVDGQAEDA